MFQTYSPTKIIKLYEYLKFEIMLSPIFMYSYNIQLSLDYNKLLLYHPYLSYHVSFKLNWRFLISLYNNTSIEEL